MPTIQIPIQCPCCQGTNIKKNGFSRNQKQKYLCKDCRRNFIGDHALTYKGCHSQIKQRVLHMLAEHCGIRHITRLEKISCGKVLSILATSLYRSKPKQQHYEQLQVDEFHTFVRNKENKLWLIYAYEPKNKEIVAYVWGKRDFATVKKLQNKLTQLGVSFTTVATDDWKSFKKAFKNHQHLIGKKYTVHIEGNNCALLHLISRATRKSYCFSKVLNNHIKAFDLGIYYLNYRHI